MARLLRPALVLVLLNSVMGFFDFDGSLVDEDELTGVLGHEGKMVSRKSTANVSHILPPEVLKMWPYLREMPKKTFDECVPALRTPVKGSWAVVRADSTQSYQAHIVKKKDDSCFRDYYTGFDDTSLKMCLESADLWQAPSFHYNDTTKRCQLYHSWRYHKFRECRRGDDEKIYYVRSWMPTDHAPCSATTMEFSVAYTYDGSVEVTGIPIRDDCCCDISEVWMMFLGNSVQMTSVPEVPKFTYTYPEKFRGYWLNDTTIDIYAHGQLIYRQNFRWDNDDFGL